jgi:hypothetical protein
MLRNPEYRLLSIAGVDAQRIFLKTVAVLNRRTQFLGFRCLECELDHTQYAILLLVSDVVRNYSIYAQLRL